MFCVGCHNYHFKLLWEAIALFVSHLSVLMWISNGVERGRKCEAASRAGVG